MATDLDEEALAGARQGLYGERAVSQVPPELLARWFKRRGKLYELDAGLRSHIDYQQVNLAHAPFALPFTECDLVLMRNVLIYFRRPLQRWVVSQVAKLLAPEGCLFLGASETLWQIQDELESVDLGPCFAYRHRKSRAGAGGPGIRRRRSARRAAPPPETPRRRAPAGPSQTPRDWSVARAAAVAPAGSRRPRRRVPRRAAQPSGSGWWPPPGTSRPTASKRRAGPSQAALAADPSEPAAHALEGFLHDLCGRTEEAVNSYRAALYLDPALFQVRVLLADCLLRLGNRDRAEHQFREVLTLLAGGRERPWPSSRRSPCPTASGPSGGAGRC